MVNRTFVIDAARRLITKREDRRTATMKMMLVMPEKKNKGALKRLVDLHTHRKS